MPGLSHAMAPCQPFRTSRIRWALGLVGEAKDDPADLRNFSVVTAGVARQAGTALSDYAREERQTPGMLKRLEFTSFEHVIGKTFLQRIFGPILALDAAKGMFRVFPVTCVVMGTYRQHLGHAGTDNP